MRNFINKCSDYLNKLVVSVGCVIFFVLVVATIIQVLCRYFLKVSVPWTEELARFAFIWATMLGASVLVKTKGHPAVDVLTGKLKGVAKSIQELLVCALMLAACCIGVYFGFQLVSKTLLQFSPALRVPYGYAKKVWRLPKETKRYTFKESMRLTLKALPTLLLPVIILGGIYGGIFTPTEAGAIGAMYSVVLGIVYRSLTWKKLVDVFKKSLEASAMAGFLIGMSSIFCWIIAAAKIPAQIVDTLLPVLNGNTFFFWVAFLLILLVAGCVLEALSAVVILAPILIPVGLAMGLEPMHLAVVFCVTMTIGIVTPPFGGVLFTTVSITKTPFGEVAKGEIPYIFAMILVCVLIAIFPDLALWLPNLMQS